MERSYFSLAYYHLTPIENPQEEVKIHKKFFEQRDIKGRIYISKEGINGQMSASLEEAEAYQQWMRGRPSFATTVFKLQATDGHIFDRLTVKEKKQLVAVDLPIDFSKRAAPLSPEEWKRTLDEQAVGQSDEQVLVLDVRNDYEGVIGHFEGALIPPCKTFREFPAYIRELKKNYDPKKTRVLMYCTGGIRCEFYSPLMREEGFDNLYQLDGGVIDYGLKVGSKHWKGKLFVFDDRLAVPISEEPCETISHCHHCEAPSDRYINCANMDCNELFLCCPTCLPLHHGCCSEECSCGGRIREFQHEDYPKPFRRMSHEKKQALNEKKQQSCSCPIPH